MDAFEAARAKYEKEAARKAKYQAPEQKVSETPKIKISNNADIALTVTVGGVRYPFNFRIPNMLGSIHGFTAVKLQTMLREALQSQFGKRIEDVNDVY